MFEVLAFVWQNYGRRAPFPEARQLGRRLSAHGFDDEDIGEALHWLDGLSLATQDLQRHDGRPAEDGTASPALALHGAPGTLAQSAGALRVYCAAEQDRLGAEGLGFIRFLEASNALPMPVREIVLDRAMAASDGPVALDKLKIIVLLVYWRAGVEPGALVLDELLCCAAPGRVAH